MRFFVSVLFLFLAVLNTANAAPSTHNGGIRSLMLPVELMGKRESHAKATLLNEKRNLTTTSKSKNESPSCARARLLAQGIEMNIKDQHQEQASLEKIVALLAQTPVDQNAFAEAKATLLNFVQLGIAIRQMNQMIATADNPANPGLNIVANAQLTELSLSGNLTGNPVKDREITDALKGDFKGGIEQNKKNKAAATQTCDGSSTTTPSGSSPTGTGT